MSAEQQPLPIPRDAAPWVRFGARFLDTYIFVGPVLAVLLSAGLSGLSNWFAEYFAYPALVLLAFTVVEAVMLATWGTTPGRWLLNVRVTDACGRNLPFGRAWRRASMVYWRGMGAGLSLFMLIGHFAGYKALVGTGTTAWDRQTQARVSHGPVGPLRTVVALAIILSPYVYLILQSRI